MEEFVLHLLPVGHQHRDEGVLLHHQQVIPANDHLAVSLCQGEGGVFRQLGDDLSGLTHHLVHLANFQVQRLVDLLRLLHGQPVLFHQLVHIQPVALGRRDAPGRGVGLFQVAQVLQLRHLVADGSRRDLQASAGHNGFGADRFRGLYVVFDDRAKDLFLALRQFHFSGLLWPFHSFSTQSS